MSDVDPDLQSKEKNLPIAIDVVDGQLVVKRHSGKKESFPLGGSIKSTHYYEVVYTLIEQPSANPDSLGNFSAQNMQFDPATAIILKDEPTNVQLASASYDDIIAAGDPGVEMEDLLFYAQDESNCYIYFKNPGLYYVAYSSQMDSAAAPGKMNVDFNFGTPSSLGVVDGNTTDLPRLPSRIFYIPVIPTETGLTGASLVPSSWFKSDQTPQTTRCQVEIMKIL